MDRLAKLLTITDKEEMQDVINQEKLLKSYYNKLSYLSNDSEYKKGLMNENIERTMEFVDAYNDGLNDGWHRGMEKGIEQNRKEMVLKMYSKKLSISLIINIIY